MWPNMHQRSLLMRQLKQGGATLVAEMITVVLPATGPRIGYMAASSTF